MANPVLNVFLSAVTKELGSYRAEVAKALREKGLHVKIQEDFNTGPGTLLEKLDAYIQQCHAVVCLMGDRYGAEPPDAERIKLGGQRHSYTQWEYLLARKRGKSVYTFRPASEETPRDPDHAANPEEAALTLLQRTFWQTQIIDHDIDRTPFANQTDLVRKVLICDFAEAKSKSEDRPLPPLNTTSPYVGLRRFEEKDKANFYGRTALIDNLLERSAGTPLLLITGNSGSGKSSVVRAGVIPKWRLGSAESGKVSAERIAVVCTPNTNPYDGLWAGLVAAGIDGDKVSFVRTPSPTVFRDLVAKFPTPNFLIFVDQFEEIFTRIPEKVKKLRETFIAALVDAGSRPTPPLPNSTTPSLQVVLAMRDDFFGNLRDHEALFRITDKSLERVIAMKGPELREIIEEPARSHGVRFQEGLVKTIAEAVEGRAGMLPLLQYTLKALWNQELHTSKEPRSSDQQPVGGVADGILSRKSYNAIGGVVGALQKRVTHFYESKTVDQRLAIRNILLSLVEVNESTGESITVSRAVKELSVAGSEEILKELLNEEKLLISMGGEADEPLVELAHEALIKGWQEFESWVQEGKEAIQIRNHLRGDAKRWHTFKGKAASEELWHGSRLERAMELEKDGEFERIGGLGDLERAFVTACQRERRAKVRRLRLGIALTSVIAVGAIFAALAAVGMGRLAEEQRRDADAQKQIARIQAGKGHMLRAEIHRLSSDSPFYAGRAVGFSRLGRSEPEAKNAPRRSIRLALLETWNWITDRLHAPPFDDSLANNEFPVLFKGGDAAEDAARAYHEIAMAAALPFVWSSPVASQHSDSVRSVAWSPDGETLASASDDNSIKLWEVASGKQKATLSGYSGSVNSVAWSPDGDTLASGSEDGSIKLWDVASGKEKATLDGHSRAVKSVTWSPDGTSLASGSEDQSIRLWNVTTATEKATLHGHSGPVNSVAWSPDGQTLASGSGDNSIKLWNPISGKEKSILSGHSEGVLSVAWSPDGQSLASGSADNRFKLWDVASGKEKANLTGHSGPVMSVNWSPDGRTLASGSWDNSTKLWDVASGKGKATLAIHSGWVSSVAWSPDGQTLASGSEDNTIRLWNPIGEEKSPLKGLSTLVWSVACSPDGQIVASGTADHSVKLWDAASGKEKASLQGHSGYVISVAWSPDGQTLASASGDGTIKLWDLASGKEKTTLIGHSHSVMCVAWSPDGLTLASCSADHSIKLWDVLNSKEKASLNGHSGWVISVAWSPDGQTLASGSEDGSIKLWDVTNSKEKASLNGHSGYVISVAWNPDGHTLASGSADHTIKLWDTLRSREKMILAGHSNSVHSVAWSPDGQILASGSKDNNIKLWDVTRGNEKSTLTGHSKTVTSVTWGPDGQTLASGSADHSIKLWDVTDGKERATLEGHSDTVFSVTWSPGGQILASASEDGSIKLWDVGSGNEKAPLVGHSKSVRCVAWSPVDPTLASGSDDNTIKVWDVASGKEKATLAGHSESVWCTAWSPDGQTLASGSEDRSIKLWDMASGKEKAILKGHSHAVMCLAWSPDGQMLASGSADHKIKLWNVVGGNETATLKGHSDDVRSVAWSPVAQTLASGSEDCTVKLWDVASGNEIANLKGHLEEVNSVAWSPNGQTLTSGSGDGSIKLWELAKSKEKATLKGHSDSVMSVAWSPDGQILGSGAADHSIKLWDGVLSLIAPPDLYIYVTEAWCQFDLATEELRWQEPRRELFRAIKTPFRNVPRWSSLGIRQRYDLGADERNWIIYVKVLQAKNWSAVPIFYRRLTAEQKQRPHAAVVWAIRTLANQSVTACKDGLPILGRMRVAAALECLSGLGSDQTERFYFRLGEGCAENGVEIDLAIDVLAALPNDAARARVSWPIIVKGVAKAEDFDSVVAQIALAGKWGGMDAGAVFARRDRDSLINVIKLALKSDHAEAKAYALAASEALLVADPHWEGSYYLSGRALNKSHRPAEALRFYEKALGMTMDEDNKERIIKALEEAETAMKAAAPATNLTPATK